MTSPEFTDRLAAIGGANLDVLKKVPSAKPRAVAMGCVLIMTSGMAFVAMTFAMLDGVHTGLALAPIIGMVWALVIFTIDRFLVLSMGSITNTRQLLLMAAPRLIAAALIGLVVSTPLVLRIFSSEIQEQMYKDQLHASTYNKGLVAGSQQQAELTQTQNQIDADQRILAGHLPVSVTSPALQTANQKVAKLSSETHQAYLNEQNALDAWQCELYGAGKTCYNASDKSGYGVLAVAKHQEYEHAVNAYRSDSQQLQAAKQAAGVAAQGVAQQQSTTLAQAQAKARAELPRLEQQLATDKTAVANLQAAGNNSVAHSNGILAQLKALSELDKTSFSLEIAHLTLAMLFFMIEIMPVLAKILLNLGPPSAYDVVAKADDDEIVDQTRAERLENRKILEDKSAVRIETEADMREHEKILGKHGNEIVADMMKQVLEAALDQWKAQAAAALAASNPVTTATPTPNPVQAGKGAAPTLQPTVTGSNNVLVLPDASSL